MNSVNIIGNLTKDIEVRSTDSGTQIGTFTLAVRRDENATDFITCKAFNKTAELIQKYTHKGSKLGVSGRIQTGSYQNKDGVTIYTTDVMVNQMYLLDTKNNPEQKQNMVVEDVTSYESLKTDEIVLTEEDYPF